MVRRKQAPTKHSVEDVPFSEIVLIPAGPFLMGAPPDEIELPAFRIARYPVTNEQYHHFISVNDRRPPDHWPVDGTFPSDLAHHPVVNVSFEDAVAYVRWIGGRLPTEAEWEKAARGADGRRYPWGDDFDAAFCNTSESGTDGTRPVDAHAKGASPFGVVDMAGNVWEWTSTIYEVGEEWRVLKGGAWDYKGVKDALCANRVYFRPAFRNSAVGFRCCWDAGSEAASADAEGLS